MDDPRRVLERVTVIALFGAPFLIVVGLSLYTLQPQQPSVLAMSVAMVGVVLLAALLRVTYNVDHLRTIQGREASGLRYERAQRMTAYRAAAVLLDLLILLAGMLLVAAALLRFDVLSGSITSSTGLRVTTALAMAVGVTSAIAFYLSLRVGTGDKQRPWTDSVALYLTYVVALASGAMALYVHVSPVSLLGREVLLVQHSPVLALIAFTALAIGIHAVRSIPGIYAIFKQGDSGASLAVGGRAKVVLMPTVIAFSLLLVVLLLVLVYGVGFIDIVGQVTSDPALLILTGLIVLGIVGTLFIAGRLAASQDKKATVKPLYKERERTENWVLGVSVGVALVVIALALLVKSGAGFLGVPQDNWFDVVSFSLLIALGPFGFYVAQQRKRIQRLEDRFPDFLRDVASSHRGGLTLPASVLVAARGEYGALTPDIQKMADQLSWNVSFEEALKQLSQRVRTPLVERAVNLILEASRSGGNTYEVIMAAARDAREIKSIENERRLTMSLYAVVIYVTFFVFLLVVALLHSQFVPQILEAGSRAENTGATGFGGLQFTSLPTLEEYRTFYFAAAVVQAIGSGVLAGMMGTGRAVLGLRHAFVMVLAAWFTFTFII